MKRKPYFLQVSPDLLYVTLLSAKTEDESVQIASSAELNRLLIDQEIVYGLDQEAVNKAISCIDRAEPLTEPLVLASGTPPIAAFQGMQLQFATQSVTIEETDGNGKSMQSQVTLAPLVRTGDILAKIDTLVFQPGKNVLGQEIAFCPLHPEYVLLPGDYMICDEEKQQLIATASGYPLISTTQKGAVEQRTLSIDKLIKVTPNRMQAILCLRPIPPDLPFPDQDTLLHILDEEKISFGRQPHAAGQCLDKAFKERRPQQTVIALGTLPVKGKDAWLRFEMDVGPLPGKVMGNGEIDFRERNMFIGVSKDQLIAVKIPPTAGTPGKDIFGNPVTQEPGKDIALNVTDDAAYNEATGEIRATRSGVLTKVSEGSVKVCSRQVIAQDVDFQTGNINSNDSLEIKGSIKPKFKVNALGDILITGTIEKAQVKSDSNVVVKIGLIGELSDIHAKGDVDIHLVEHGRIYAGGSIILRKNAYFCRMYANGNIQCDSSSRIVHSHVVAAGSITTGTVGSDSADPSLIAAAVSPEQLQRYFDLKRTIEAQIKEIKTLRMRLGREVASDELDELTVELEENEHKLANLNLICPDSPKSTDKGLPHALQCTIVVRGKVFAGTDIRIGNSRLVLEETLSNIQFQLQDPLTITDHKAKVGIIATPLTK